MSIIKGSAFYYQIALSRWARMKNIDISQPSRIGLSFYVDVDANGIIQFAIDSRGTNYLRGCLVASFCGETNPPYDPEREAATERAIKRIYRKGRQQAWLLAAPMFLRMTNQGKD